jgi:hypothetical protein
MLIALRQLETLSIFDSQFPTDKRVRSNVEKCPNVPPPIYDRDILCPTITETRCSHIRKQLIEEPG